MENAEVVDRISNLPDELLVVILSLLPIKDAFSTILVSKRWTSLCKLLPGRYCNDKSVKVENDLFLFCIFVDRQLSFTKVMKTFHLHCESRLWNKCNFNNIRNLIRLAKQQHTQEDLHRSSSCQSNLDFRCSFKKFQDWIRIAKQRQLENLHLSSCTINLDFRITLPPTIFIFPTLVVLKLSNFNLYGDISVDLPLLKTLHLNHVCFINHHNFDKLLYGCPMLQDLFAHHVSYYMDDVSVNTNPRVSYYFMDVAVNTNTNTRESKPLSTLITADIDDSTVPFTAISNVKILKHQVVFVTFPTQDIYSDCKTFQNLIHLQLLIHENFRCRPLFINKDHHYLDNVMGLLTNCPKLEILSIFKRMDEIFFGVWKYPNYVPKCISSHLKSCTIDLDNLLVDLQLARYILKNAPLLVDMKMARERANIIQELSLYPRISPKCKISISGTSL